MLLQCVDKQKTIHNPCEDQGRRLWSCHLLASMPGHPTRSRRFVNPFLLLSKAIKRQTVAWGWHETCTPMLGDGGMASRPFHFQFCVLGDLYPSQGLASLP